MIKHLATLDKPNNTVFAPNFNLGDLDTDRILEAMASTDNFLIKDDEDCCEIFGTSSDFEDLLSSLGCKPVYYPAVNVNPTRRNKY